MAELRELKSMNSNDGIACKFPVSSEKELMLKQRMTSRDGFESTVSRCKNYIILHRRPFSIAKQSRESIHFHTVRTLAFLE